MEEQKVRRLKRVPIESVPNGTTSASQHGLGEITEIEVQHESNGTAAVETTTQMPATSAQNVAQNSGTFDVERGIVPSEGQRQRWRSKLWEVTKKLFKFVLLVGLAMPLMNVDLEYCHLFFDQTLDHSARSELSAKISAAIISEKIEMDLVQIDFKMGKLLQTLRMSGFGLHKSVAQHKYEELKSKMERKRKSGKLGMIDVCQLWSCADDIKKISQLINITISNMKKEINNAEQLLKRSKNPQCNELANIENLFEAMCSQLPPWAIEFREFVSEMHFLRINELLFVAEKAQQSDFKIWTNFLERIQNESELSLMLRRLNGRAEIDQIVWVKATMNRYLMDQQGIVKLEVHNPLTMAFDIIGTSMLRTAYRGMVLFEGELALKMALLNKNYLLLTVLCGKIINYFEQQLKDDKKEEKMAKLGNYWKLFKRNLESLNNQDMDAMKGLLIKLRQLLDYLRDQFGEQKLSRKWQMIVQRMEKTFSELYEESDEFRKHFQMNINTVMLMLIKVFSVAEEKWGIISAEFWQLEKLTNEMDEMSMTQNEKKASLLIKCPSKIIPLEMLQELDLKEADEDMQPILMISLYKKLLIKQVVESNHREYSTQIDLEAMRFHYKMGINLLIDFGQNLEEKNAKFEDELNNYISEWNELTEYDSKMRQLCQMHKLAHSFANNGIMIEESAEWSEFIEQLVGNPTGTPKKLIFASENDGVRWHESDCADEGVQFKLFNSLLKNLRSLYHFHFVALNMLLRGFIELRHFFCYAKNRIDSLIIKERFSYHFGEALLNTLEMTYPLIMQFDVANVTHILGLFVEQLSHKTGSFEAEMVETRVYAPALLQEMNLYAENAHDDGFTAKKVEMAKEFFYQLLIETQMPGSEESEHSIRDAFCVLYHFFECMMEEKQLIVKVMMAHCEREENVKMAIAIQRDRMRGRTMQFVMNSLASPELMMVQRIRRTKGGRTRLWKLLYNYDQKIEQNEQEMANLWETLELSDDINIDYENNQQLISHYEYVLLSDGMNEFSRMEGKMKAEIFLVISWINAQFPPTKPFSAKVFKNVQIYLPLSVKMLDSFYDRLFDYQKIEELEQDEQELVELIMAIRGQMEQIVVGHQRTKSETELIKEWRRRNFAGVKRSKKEQKIAKAKHWAEYGPWMMQMHGQTLIKLIKTDKQFAQKLKNGDFEDDQFLALKYGEFLGILSRNDGEKARKIWFPTLEKIEEKQNLAKCAAIEHSLAHLLDIGILANEIWHYVQTMKALNGKSKDLAKFENKWAQLKQLKLEEEINKFEMDNVLEDKKQLETTKEKALKDRQNLEEQKAMLMTLSRNFMNERIFEILSSEQKLDKKYSEKKLLEDEKNNEKLRIVLSFLELWTKNNFIYGPEIGYLNTPMLLIMVAKVFLFFPEASVPFLIEKFFLIYSKWKWPIPVQLAQIEQQRSAEFLVWSPGREWFTKKQFGSGKISETMAMPIISPLFPEQNEAYRINLSTAKVIQNELKLAFLQIRNMDETRQILEPILGNKKFTQKYEHFVTFVCAGTEWNVEKFCHFVGKRLGHELLHFVEQSSANLINFCHIYPKLVQVEQQLSEDKKWKNLQKRIWLVGLKLQKQKKRNDEALTSELKAVLSSKLAEIDAKIKNDFEGKRYYNVRLNSEFVERSELENLGNF
ncbi:hypothetical protein niasHT_010934 [Heterodera trifolii]|uniref:polynucleotide adenylyltransferase n=1 Tax=Heterodera trifolii TaxID=157864 RepID=A0ABD2LFW0_9BILA